MRLIHPGAVAISPQFLSCSFTSPANGTTSRLEGWSWGCSSAIYSSAISEYVSILMLNSFGLSSEPLYTPLSTVRPVFTIPPLGLIFIFWDMVLAISTLYLFRLLDSTSPASLWGPSRGPSSGPKWQCVTALVDCICVCGLTVRP